jgi:hypothetical protein
MSVGLHLGATETHHHILLHWLAWHGNHNEDRSWSCVLQPAQPHLYCNLCVKTSAFSQTPTGQCQDSPVAVTVALELLPYLHQYSLLPVLEADVQ